MSPIRDRFLARLGFEPDDFQLDAFDAVDAGESVLVAAPTSSGKTLVAEYGIAAALDAGERVFYTTPIKALSNQKFNDLCSWLGYDRVGLLTGDNVIRADADVIVMTTEVLRNMIYSASPALEGLGVVVLDEVHYLQDTYRGPVWEEVIIQTPAAARLIALSATVSNAHELAEWIATVRGTCRCVIETTRPVALHQRFLVADRAEHKLADMRVLRGVEADRSTSRFIAKHAHGPRARGRRRLARPRRTEIIEHLHNNNRLPAIYFVFSRQGCDDAVQQCLNGGLSFLDSADAARVAAIAGHHTSELTRDDLSALGYRNFLAGLQAGIASHHAGLVPPFKEAVEECFSLGLLEVVFATETLALGINMPARSVVIEQLSRFRGEGHVMLTPADYSQLTGRAGRRGIDEVGYAYTLWTPYVEFDQVATLAGSKEYSLRSVFRPTYNMAANLVATRTEEGAIDLLQQSFAQFQSDRSIVRLTAELGRAKDRQEKLLAHMIEAWGTTDPPPRPGPNSAVSVETPKADPHEIERSLAKCRPGDVVERNRDGSADLLLVLGVSQRRHGGTRLRVVTARGKSMMVASPEFDQVAKVVERVSLPAPYQPARREFQKESASMLRSVVKLRTANAARDEPSGPRGMANLSDDDIDHWSVDHNRAERSRRTVERLERRLDTAADGLGLAFKSVVAVLREHHHIDGWTLTEKGRLLRRVFHEHDLWITEAVMGGVFDGLDPARLAGVASALTYERRGPGTGPAPWFPDGITRERVGDLRAIARRLTASEHRNGLAETPDPDAGFLAAAHAWALGIDVGELLSEEELSGGDFVRQIRQLVDMLRQIAAIAPVRETVEAAREAIHDIDRGLVAAATKVSEGDGL
ncbi:MAG: DEAD/DEAH box helicase [Actinomycetia bacterium]|nr:DEAD/DEAH box helicase [Actinomycetes bacterium]